MANVRVTPDAQDQIAALPLAIHARVNQLLERLADWPDVSGAKPLRGKLKGNWRVRTGDWRVLFRVSGEDVIVWSVANRRDVYEG